MRVLSLALVCAGALLLAAGTVLVVYAAFGALAAAGAGALVLGLSALGAGLFLVPVRSDAPDVERPIHGVIP